MKKNPSQNQQKNGYELVRPALGKGGGDSSVRCLGTLKGAITTGGIGPWDVDQVASITGANPTADTSEVVQVKNPIGFYGDDNAPCIFSQCKEANVALGIAAGDFVFDIIACPASS
jgi:hypothetical protein